MLPILVGIGGYQAGTIQRLEDGSHIAKIQKAHLLWDGYDAYNIAMREGMIQVVTGTVSGMNDTDEGGYVVALVDDYVYVPIHSYWVEKSEKAEHPDVYLTWYGPGEAGANGPWLVNGNDETYPIPDNPEIAGWIHPDRDQ